MKQETLSPEQLAERSLHRDIEHGEICRVREREDHYEIDTTAGCFPVSKPLSPEPSMGQSVTIYRQDGMRLRGIDIGNNPVFFKTAAQIEEERLAWLQQREIEQAEKKRLFYINLADPSSDFNVRLSTLPKVFRQRIVKFFRLGEDFWSVATYELYACMAAVKIASACRSHRRIHAFCRSSSSEEKLEVLGQEVHDYLSGHQFAFACTLACSYLRSAKSVRTRPGAMQLVTGPKTYFG